MSTKTVDDDKSLLSKFDDFALLKGFKKFSSDPGAHAYRKQDGKIELDIIVGVGNLGSIVSLYDSSQSKDLSEVAAVKSFLASTVGPSWSFKDCNQIKDFIPPSR